jgi:hypothetical protein
LLSRVDKWAYLQLSRLLIEVAVSHSALESSQVRCRSSPLWICWPGESRARYSLLLCMCSFEVRYAHVLFFCRDLD